MTALPSNLVRVGEDLARATLRDANRSRARRRLVTYVVAFALLALTATAAIASGWLFGGERPVVRVVPSLGGASLPLTVAPGKNVAMAQDLTRSEARHRAGQTNASRSSPLGETDGAAAATLLANLGPHKRSLTAVPTTTGGVCLTLTDFGTECVPTFSAGDHIDWFVRATPGEKTVIWGIVSDDVTAVDAVSTSGATTVAQIGNGGFYAELTDGSPERLILRLSDGSFQSLNPLPCPLATPDCKP
jgi:hypothetical protein